MFPLASTQGIRRLASKWRIASVLSKTGTNNIPAAEALLLRTQSMASFRASVAWCEPLRRVSRLQAGMCVVFEVAMDRPEFSKPQQADPTITNRSVRPSDCARRSFIRSDRGSDLQVLEHWYDRYVHVQAFISVEGFCPDLQTRAWKSRYLHHRRIHHR